MGKSLKELREKRDALIRQKNRHLQKIETALQTNENLLGIIHWEAEIENFENQIRELNTKICKHKH